MTILFLAPRAYSKRFEKSKTKIFLLYPTCIYEKSLKDNDHLTIALISPKPIFPTSINKRNEIIQSRILTFSNPANPVLGVLVFLPRSWIILDNLEFLAKILDFFICCQDLGILRFLTKILAINLAKKSKKNQDLAKKSKIIPVNFKEENHSYFDNYKLGS